MNDDEPTVLFLQGPARSRPKRVEGPRPLPASPQDVVVGRDWRLISRLGRGGFAEVWRAQNVRTQLEVAVKLLTLEEEEAKERFSAEVGALMLLRNAGVARVLEAGRSGGRHYYVMDLVKGRTLREVLEEGATMAAALSHARQIAAVMADVHRHNIVHRDLSPENVMICADRQCRSEVRVVLLDFGVAKLPGLPTEIATGLAPFLGKWQYASPEQIDNSTRVTTASDCFSLGVVLCEMFGLEVWTSLADIANKPRRLSDVQAELTVLGVPPALRELIAEMLDVAASRRPSMNEVVAKLDSVIESESSAVAAPAPGGTRVRFYGALAIVGMLGAGVGAIAGQLTSNGSSEVAVSGQVDASVVTTVTPLCSGGLVASEFTSGKCCFPGQAWNGAGCVGRPTRCPLHRDSTSDGCAPCAMGLVQSAAGGQCCWPGQTATENGCDGTPQCPSGYLPSANSCSAMDWKGSWIGSGHGNALSVTLSEIANGRCGQASMSWKYEDGERAQCGAYLRDCSIDGATIKATMPETGHCYRTKFSFVVENGALQATVQEGNVVWRSAMKRKP